MKTDKISKEHVYRHNINSIWNAISTAKEITAWFIEADFKAEKGYQYTFTASEEYDRMKIRGTVKEATPYTLVYTWILQDTDVETTVSWTLTETEAGTHLLLEHSGISGYEGETAVTMLGNYNQGWSDCIVELAAHLKSTLHVG